MTAYRPVFKRTVYKLVFIMRVYINLCLEWRFGRAVCQFFLSIDYTASTASIFNLFILSLDRCVGSQSRDCDTRFLPPYFRHQDPSSTLSNRVKI